MKKTFIGTASREFHRGSKPVSYHYPNSPHMRGYVQRMSSVHTVYHEEGKVELSIDIDKMMRVMGERALSSKRGISRFMGGILVARVLGDKKQSVVSERAVMLPDGAEIINPGEKP